MSEQSKVITWRKYFAPQIRALLEGASDADWGHLRKILRKSFPEKDRTPYRMKVWYAEAKGQYAEKQEVPDHGPLFEED